ncbi:hypothetical protein Q3G72_011253 [Acer saccharum]|nr:hypothetical protein Q3G72_011253 [Acer saccharum]
MSDSLSVEFHTSASSATSVAVDVVVLSGRNNGTTREEEFSDSNGCDSVSRSSTCLVDLPVSFWVFFESLRRRELAEMEMMKSGEAVRCEAKRRRIETEAELTQILV